MDKIKTNFKRLANIWHPDKHANMSSLSEANKKFREINIAFQKLKEAKK